LICAAICYVAADVEVQSQKADVRPDGFDSQLSQSDGNDRKESGNEHGDIVGQFAWISPEGEHVSLSYVADENGYQPKSDWLPTPPPVPEAIIRAIEYINSHPSQDH